MRTFTRKQYASKGIIDLLQHNRDKNPTRNHDSWVVRDGIGRVVELWQVTSIQGREQPPFFTAQITEYVPI